jgi:hypothetical protein
MINNNNNNKETTMLKTKINVSLPRNSYNHELAEKLKSATQFILKELMSVKMANTLKIKIHVRKTTLGARTLGQVEHDTNGSKSQKEFLIELRDDQSDREKIITLAHELVHVQQNVSKKLQYRFWSSDRKLHVRWENKELGEPAQIPYRERPWEVEAFAKQEILADMFNIPHLTKFKREELKKLN